MATTFYAAAVIAIVATALAITQKNVVHGLLYLIVSLLAVALIFFVIGAPFVAALEVIIYAGAIMVLFVFVMMLLNLGPQTVEQEQRWLHAAHLDRPARPDPVLLAELLYALGSRGAATTGPVGRSAADRDRAVRPLRDRVELASMLLLAGLIGAYHLGRRQREGS